MHTTRATKQQKTGPELHDLDGDGRRFAVSVDGVIRFTGSREECEKRLEILLRPTTREQQDKRLGRIFGALVLVAMLAGLVPRGTLADSTIVTTQPVQNAPYNAAPIRQNFGFAAADIEALQSMNAGASAPSAPVLGTLWLETPAGETTYILHIWNTRQNQWTLVAYFDSANSIWIAPVGGGLPADILSQDTTDLGALPNTVITVTGQGPIYSFGSSSPAGAIKVLTFAGTTQIVYNSTSMILPGAADINAVAGDMAFAVALGSGNWQVMFFQSAASSVAQGGTGRTSLTAHSVLLGEGTSPINFAVPGTTGYPLLSTGASSDPAFGQLSLTVGVTGILPVANGGTGLASPTIHNLVIGNGTSAMTLLAPGTSGLPLVSLGASLDPHYAVLTVPGGGTGLATMTAHAVPVGAGTANVVMVGPGTNKYPFVANGGSADPSFQPLDLASVAVVGILSTTNGGTGLTAPAVHTLLVGNGTSAMHLVTPGTAGYPLLAAGASADPLFDQLDLAGVGVTGVLPQAKFTMTPTFTTLATTGNAGIGGDLAVTGVTALTGAVTTTGNLGVGAILAVTGATNLGTTLGVTGAASLNGGLAVTGATTMTGALTVTANITDVNLPTVAAGTSKHFVCIDPVSGIFYRGTGVSCN